MEKKLVVCKKLAMSDFEQIAKLPFVKTIIVSMVIIVSICCPVTVYLMLYPKLFIRQDLIKTLFICVAVGALSFAYTYFMACLGTSILLTKRKEPSDTFLKKMFEQAAVFSFGTYLILYLFISFTALNRVIDFNALNVLITIVGLNATFLIYSIIAK